MQCSIWKSKWPSPSHSLPFSVSKVYIPTLVSKVGFFCVRLCCLLNILLISSAISRSLPTRASPFPNPLCVLCHTYPCSFESLRPFTIGVPIITHTITHSLTPETHCITRFFPPSFIYFHVYLIPLQFHPLSLACCVCFRSFRLLLRHNIPRVHNPLRNKEKKIGQGGGFFSSFHFSFLLLTNHSLFLPS